MEQYLSVCRRLAQYSGGPSVGIITRAGRAFTPGRSTQVFDDPVNGADVPQDVEDFGSP